MVQMKPVVFHYKPIRGRLAPIITIGVKIGGIWYPIEVYLDSGSASITGAGSESIFKWEMEALSPFIYTILRCR